MKGGKDGGIQKLTGRPPWDLKQHDDASTNGEGSRKGNCHSTSNLVRKRMHRRHVAGVESAKVPDSRELLTRLGRSDYLIGERALMHHVLEI